MSKKRLEEARASGLHVIQVIDVASMIGTGSIRGGEPGSFNAVPPAFTDLLDDCTYEPHSSTKWVREIYDLHSTPEVFASKLLARGCIGFFLEVGFDGTQDPESPYEWTYGESKFVYGDTYEEAWACGLDWAWSVRPWRAAVQESRCSDLSIGQPGREFKRLTGGAS